MRYRVYIAIALVLVLVGFIGWNEATSFERSYAERERRELQERLAQLVDQWESLVTDRVTPWLTELGSEQDLSAREAVHRAASPFFDAVYLWEGRDFSFPAEGIDESVGILRTHPCVQTAGEAVEGVDPIDIARRYAGCIGSERALSLFAASQAVEILLNAEQPLLAHELIRRLGPIATTPLDLATRRSVSVRRLAQLRLQHARAMDGLGRTDVAEHWITGLAIEIATLDAPDLEAVIDLYAWPIAHDLKRYGGPDLGGDDDELLARAERRVLAWRELRQRTGTMNDVPLVSAGPRVLVDPYGEPPWVVYVARLGMGDLLGAVQVDQPSLTRWLIERTRPALRPFLSIRDAGGRVIAGATGDASVEVGFTRALPHLRAVLTTAAESDPSAARRAAFGRLLPFVIAIVVGLVALLGVVRSDIELMRLIDRQREFVARVSHELKTPLAGIRLMAETLEMGAYKDEVQREKFAKQIVKESERLALRVDEVIKSSTRPLVESPIPIDITAMVVEVGERWRTLFEQRGGSLTVEAEDAGLVVGMPGLLRDALTNLLDNALKYRREDRPLQAWLRLRGERRFVVIEVEDNGLGVPPNMRTAIFERFRRVEGAGRGKSGGHGLGLAFVADAARAHRGTIDCREGATTGAKFILRIRRRS